jgi:hypothetical protein
MLKQGESSGAASFCWDPVEIEFDPELMVYVRSGL